MTLLLSRGREAGSRRNRRFAVGIVSVVAAMASGCKPEPSRSTGSVNAQRGAAPTGAQAALPPDDGQWVRPAKDFASTRFSGLTEINADQRQESASGRDVLDGRAARARSGADRRGQHDVHHHALPQLRLRARPDASPGLPVKWTYNPKPELAAQGVACCDVVNRGLVYDDGKIFFNTLDDHTIALDAATGKQLWNTKVGDINIGRDDDDGAARGQREECSSAIPAARWACAAGSRRSTRIRARSRGRRITRGPTRTC